MSRKVWGIKGKNAPQHEAIAALINPEIDLVILSGRAGSGKTLLALAAGLEQVLESKTYNSIIFTRAPIPVGQDLGFLPGTIEEKLMPWCGALLDNLEFLKVNSKDTERYINFVALQHLRGRSLNNRYVIVDECSNLTMAQLKVIITRAGEDSKFILLGDPDQIDHKGLNKDNNALSTIVRHIDDAPQHFIQHIELLDCERSRLADWGGGL